MCSYRPIYLLGNLLFFCSSKSPGQAAQKVEVGRTGSLVHLVVWVAAVPVGDTKHNAKFSENTQHTIMVPTLSFIKNSKTFSRLLSPFPGPCILMSKWLTNDGSVTEPS